MNFLMYNLPASLISLCLLVAMLFVVEIGHRVGRRAERNASDHLRAHTGGIQAGLLGILALLLGFTYSQSLSRHDSRSEAVVTEANAIGTTWLRARLLPVSVRDQVHTLLREYIDVRVEENTVSIVNASKREGLVKRSDAVAAKLWDLAMQAAQENSNPVTTGLFIESLNDTIDAFASREAAINRIVPEVVMVLLFGTFLMTGFVVGYASGISGHRSSFVTYVMIGMIVLMMYIIIDLDRPRRGLIRINQKPMLDLQATISARPAPAGAASR